MAGALTRETKKRGAALVKDVARRIAMTAPALKDLDAVTLRKVANLVILESLRDDLRQQADLERVDYQAERARWLKLAAKRSKHTERGYRVGLESVEAHAESLGLPVLALTPAQVDDWITSMPGAPATVHARTAAVSAFYTWLERRHDFIRNPLRGTRARPKAKKVRELAVPTAEEVATITEACAGDPSLAAAVTTMAANGLRVGALPGLSVKAARYTTTSKGKELSGTMAPEALAAIKAARLPLRGPWAEETASRLADRFRYVTTRLQKTGTVSAVYSVHDLRHHFATRLYQETKDIYRVSKALQHAGVAVTESYLRSLQLLD